MNDKFWNTCYVQNPRNVLSCGLTLLQINPERAVELRREQPQFGWLFRRHLDGQWVTERKLSQAEIDEAYDQAADMMVLDPTLGETLRSKSGVRFA